MKVLGRDYINVDKAEIMRFWNKQRSPLSKYSAYIYIMMQMDYDIHKGTCSEEEFTMEEIAKRCKWDISKTQAFIDELITDGMITVREGNGCLFIALTRYGIYFDRNK